MPRERAASHNDLLCGLAVVATVVVGLGLYTRDKAATSADAEAMRAVCHGEPLRDLNAREQALQDGFELHLDYRCITRASWEARQRQEAERAAYQAPEAVAQRRRERDAAMAVGALRREAAEAARQARLAALDARVATLTFRPIEINTASLAELQALVVIGDETARDIVATRATRPFRDWGDLVHRVIGLSSAQNAAEASLSGLVVNGEGLTGAELNPTIARVLARRVFERG